MSLVSAPHRVGSQRSGMMSAGSSVRLPVIQHPSARLGAPETISIAGRSSALSQSIALNEAESVLRAPSNFSRATSRTSATGTTRFTNATGSRVSKPETVARLAVDEIEALLKQKLSGAGHHQLKTAWTNNDIDGKGLINRDVFRIVLSKFLNRDISSRHIELLLQRLHCAHLTQLRFSDVYSHFKSESKSTGLPLWLDKAPTKNLPGDVVTASHAWSKLKSNWGMLKDLLPVDFVAGWVVKDEFREFLIRRFELAFDSKKEFTKLWKRIDLNGFNAVKVEDITKRIAGPVRPFSSEESRAKRKPNKFSDITVIEKKSAEAEDSVPKTAVSERKMIKGNIEQWLKFKFREGFKDLRDAFKLHDRSDSGRIGRKNFRRVLGKYGLHLKDDHALNTLLSRVGILEPGDVNYKMFLTRFQDRSDQGMTYEVLKRKEKKILERPGTPGSTVTRIESKILSMLQSDYLSLVAAFHKLDRANKNTIAKSEFQALLESRFGLEMDSDEFNRLLKNVPLDKKENIKYPEFLSQFDAGRENKSLFAPTEYTSASRARPVKKRKTEDLNNLIEFALQDGVSKIEEYFREVDQLNHGWLTVETLFQLLQKLDLSPAITRDECRKLWPQFRLNAKNTLDWDEFLRHYMYSQETAAFPNAKKAPPRKGDDDLNRRSNKLNGVVYFLKSEIRTAVEMKFEQFQEKFISMDPYHTGFITAEEFSDILKDTCDELEDADAEEICKAYDTNHDDRVNYIEFLKPFADRRRIIRGDDDQVLKSRATAFGEESDILKKFIDLIVEKKIAHSTVRREFRKCDLKNSGKVPISDMKTLVRRFGISFDSDDIYKLATLLDRNVTGYIQYSDIITLVQNKTPKISPIC